MEEGTLINSPYLRSAFLARAWFPPVELTDMVPLALLASEDFG